MVLFKKRFMLSNPPGFKDFEKSNHVYKLQNALYGLKQAPRAWYERLSKIFMDKEFSRCSVDIIFLKKHKHSMLVAQIYVDDILFGATNQDLCEHFAKEM